MVLGLTHRFPRSLVGLLPDEARWIDLRGLLLTERCDVWAEASPDRGFVARSWDFPFAALYGRPRLDLITAATAAGRAAHDERTKSVPSWSAPISPPGRPAPPTALR